MNKNQKSFAKGFMLAAMAMKRSNLTKAYVATTFAAIYGIRAAREANREAEAALDRVETTPYRRVPEGGE